MYLLLPKVRPTDSHAQQEHVELKKSCTLLAHCTLQGELKLQAAQCSMHVCPVDECDSYTWRSFGISTCP